MGDVLAGGIGIGPNVVCVHHGPPVSVHRHALTCGASSLSPVGLHLPLTSCKVTSNIVGYNVKKCVERC